MRKNSLLKLKPGWYKLTPRLLIVIVLFISIFAMAIREQPDPDMWWHLAAGRYITEQRVIPREDVFSHTKLGTRWFMHEWLTEVVMYNIYRVGGVPALLLTSAAVVAVAYAIVYVQCDGRPYLAAFVVLLGAVASAVTWGIRPQMLNILFMALSMFILERYRDGHQRAIWILPFLIAVWCNMHAGFWLALWVLGTVLFGDGLALLLGYTSERRLSFKAWRNLAGIACLCVLAALINPNTYHMLTYPFETLTSSSMQAYIQEWASPNFHQREFLPFAMLLLGGAAILVFARRKVALTDYLLFFGFALAGLISARNIPLFVIPGVPIISRAFKDVRIFSGQGRNFVWLNWLVIVLAVGGTVVHFFDVYDQYTTYMQTHYPIAAIDYIKSSDLVEQDVYNTYGWGGYLIWHKIPVFIDGRADVYGDEFIEQFLAAYFVRPKWHETLDTYRPDYLLVEAHSSFAVLLAEVPAWVPVYEDDVAVIFVRGAAVE